MSSNKNAHLSPLYVDRGCSTQADWPGRIHSRYESLTIDQHGELLRSRWAAHAETE